MQSTVKKEPKFIQDKNIMMGVKKDRGSLKEEKNFQVQYSRKKKENP